MTVSLDNLDATVDSAERTARHYWFEDGVTEIGVGGVFALVGLLFFAEAVAPPGSRMAGMSAILLPLVMIGGVFGARRFIRAMKERITYPRTGYVALPDRRTRARRLWPAALVGGTIGAVVAALLVNAPASLTWLPALDGIVIGAFILLWAARLDVGRFYVLAIVSVAIGLAATLSGIEDPMGSAVYFGGFGLVLMAEGAWVLGMYMRRTRAGTAAVVR